LFINDVTAFGGRGFKDFVGVGKVAPSRVKVGGVKLVLGMDRLG